MRSIKMLMMLALALCLMWTPRSEATYVQQMNLGEITNNADMIFRGKLINIETSSVEAGGGELPTVKYTLRVSDLIKGDMQTDVPKATNIVHVTMLGRIKAPAANSDGIRYAGFFKTPVLNLGQEYLLFTTSPSSLGLSMTVGIEQGLFRFTEGEKVMNDAKNAGLFRNMDSQGMNNSGPIPYSAIAERIRSLSNN